LKIGQNFFLQHFRSKIILNFEKFVATKKGMTTIFFSPLSFVAVFGSGIRDPRSKLYVLKTREGGRGAAYLKSDWNGLLLDPAGFLPAHTLAGLHQHVHQPQVPKCLQTIRWDFFL
jgi:hypothetical protein